MNALIYGIKNKVNDRIYVGRTTMQNTKNDEGLRKRWSNHKSILKSGNHYCADLQNDYDSMGKSLEVFEFFVLERLSNSTPEKIQKQEQYWLDYYRSKLYNDRDIAEILSVKNINKEKLSKSQSGENNPMAKLSENEVRKILELIKENKLSQGQLAALFGVTQATISRIRHKVRWRHVS